MMKNIFKSGIIVAMAIFAMASCAPQDKDDYALGAMPEVSQMAFSVTPKSGQPNVIELKNESSVKGVVTWDMGDGTTAKGEAAEAQYPFKGTYVVAMTMYTTGGSATVTQEVTVAQDDMSLLNTPMYNALTGGADNLEGKTWVFDQYHNGHFGVGPNTDTSPSWWSCPANEKLESSLYTQEFTFIQVGVKMIWKNNGFIYTNEPGKNALGGTAVAPPAGDFDVAYVPKDAYTFTLNEAAKTITLSDGAFLGHYAGTSTYEILTLTDDELYVKCNSTIEPGNGWWYRFIPKEKNVNPETEAKPLAEDFGQESVSSFGK